VTVEAVSLVENQVQQFADLWHGNAVMLPPGSKRVVDKCGTKRVPMTIDLAFAWRVTDLNPLACIQNAMTRTPRKPGLPDQRLSLMEVLKAYTRNGAWVEFMEDRKGILRPGYLADIVVLDSDIEGTASGAIGRIKPALTICDGKISYQA